MKLMLSSTWWVVIEKMESESLQRYAVEGLEAMDASYNKKFQLDIRKKCSQ